ncbi:unnamed protein product [Rhizophagus irregularis]|nr:unnamed protein product [Rhizophagus irregularis]
MTLSLRVDEIKDFAIESGGEIIEFEDSTAISNLQDYKRIIIDTWSKNSLSLKELLIIHLYLKIKEDITVATLNIVNLANLETNDKKQVALKGLIDPVIDEYVIKIVNFFVWLDNIGYVMNIIHGDLHLKIASFGLSKQLTEVTYNSMNNRMGIIEYVEPRCLRNVIYVKDKRSDVYSLTITSIVSLKYQNINKDRAGTQKILVSYGLSRHFNRWTNYVRDGKSSIYSLGVLFWEIISGQPPRDDRLEPINMIPSCHA